ncbi:MAG: PLP-dependent aminotransferase family protein [Planctomycetota bacterium]|nr:MAG: PLP-dependent aminotransferase family protein [Planctomycetota bacterium]
MTIARRLSQRAQLFGQQPISELMRMALAQPELISLAAGFVDQASLPVDEARKAAEAVFADVMRGRAALQYGTNAGYLPLREAVLQRMLAADGQRAAHPPTVDQVILTAGSNQLLHLVGEVLLDPGDIVLCAAPTYFVFLGMLNSLGAHAVGVAIDEDGMIPEALVEELERQKQAGQLERVKAIYLTSYYENPSTVSLSLERRAQIVEIAKRHSEQAPLYVIDDAAYRELRYAGDSLPSLRAFDEEGDTVIVAETFSKSFSPGVRVGWGILPPELVPPVSGLKASIDFGSPHLNQHLMSAVLERGLFESHVAMLQAAYLTKLQAMLKAMDDFLGDIPGARWHRPTGGLYVWLELPEGMDAGPGGLLIEHALAEGVLYVPGEYCYPSEGEPVRRDRIRLSFGVQTAENIRRGVESLSRAIRRLL